MAIGIVAGLVFFFYFLAVPVKTALKIHTFPALRFGAGFSVFEGRFALRQAQKRINGEKKRLPWKKFPPDLEKIRAYGALKYLIRHLEMEKLSVEGSVSLSDAAATAMVCGGCEAVRSAIAPFGFSERISLALEPDFSGSGSRITMEGMVSIRAGHIICAALIGAIHLAKGKITRWKSIRLRTL